jgi:hypothetical protein
MTRALAILFVLLAGTASADATDTGAMRAAAEGFYKAYGTFHPSDGIPDGKALERYRPFLSPKLETLLEQAGAAEARFAAANKDSPPLIEGDLFSSLFEGATSVAVGNCVAAGDRGQCTADLRHDEAEQKPVTWSDTVYLMATPQGWRVDDIGYGGTWAFGNKGRLTTLLGQVIHFQ